MSENQNYKNCTQNIFCFDDFCDFEFFSDAGNSAFRVFVFGNFAFFFGTGAARRKIQNRKK